MEKSQSITEIAIALHNFQNLIGTIKKDGENPFFRSKYATLDNIIETIKGPLTKCGLSFSQFPSGDNELITILLHISGEYIQASAKISPKDNSPQAQGSAITYMRRYALSSVLGLATEVDDDGNEASIAKKGKAPVKRNFAPKNSIVDEHRMKLMTLFKELDFDPIEIENKEYLQKEVKKLTQLDFIPENYEEIIGRLQIVVDEKK